MTVSRDVFASEVRAVILQMHPAATIKPLPGDFGFLIRRTADTNLEQQLVLGNVFHETCSMDVGARRRAIVRVVRMLSMLDEPIGDWEQVRPRLVPLLRSCTIDFDRAGVVCRPFAPYLIECVGLDSDDGIMYVTPNLAQRWGVSIDELFAAAHQTAANVFLEDVSLYDPSAPYPIWTVSRPDSYESSRLAMPGWLASFAGRVEGRPVAIVPSREVLIVGGDGDERCVRRLIEMAKSEYQKSPRSVSTALYTTNRDGRVVPLLLPETHPLTHEVALGHMQLAMAEYDRQRDGLVEAAEEDIFVTSLQGMRRSDGSVFSYAQWSYGIPSLLPKADQIVLMLTDGMDRGAPLTAADILCVPWAEVLGIVGECLVQEPSLDPPRWRTKSWPDAAKIARLRLAAVPLRAETPAPSELN